MWFCRFLPLPGFWQATFGFEAFVAPNAWLYNPLRRIVINPAETSDFVIAELIRIASNTIGMDVSVFKKEHLLKRFKALADKSHCKELSDLITLFKANPDKLRILSEFIPLGLTEFFRDPSAFELVLNYFDDFPARYKSRRSFKLLSAGCGTGEEAVSLACVAHRAFSKLECDFSLLGLDLAVSRIEFARKGIYYAKASSIPEYYLKEGYFAQLKGGSFKQAQHVAKNIRFQNGNFFTDGFAKEHFSEFDFVACRYVLSSMNFGAITGALPYLLATIRPKGLLWLAVGEFIDNPASFGLKLIDANLYERPG